MSDPLRDIGKEEGDSLPSREVDERVKFWIDELELSRKREEKYQKDARRVVKLYEGDRRDDNSFNILYANTETLLPAVYNQLPRPFVDRRYKDADQLGKASAKVLERTLSELQDNGDAEYDQFNDLMEQAVLGALVPGRGVTWFRYDAKLEGGDTPTVDDGEGKGEGKGEGEGAENSTTGEQTVGRVVLVPTGEKVAWETVCGEDIDYDQIRFGFARRWAKLPWLARRHEMTKDDVAKSFPEPYKGKGVESETAWCELLTFAIPEKEPDWKRGDEDSTDKQRSTQPVTEIWEIWNKEKKEVLFFSPTFKSDVIKCIDDPLGLSGFFPCPQPLRFLVKRSKLTPTPLYILYEEQAKELNRLTQRINRIIHALKVRGFYDGSLQGLKELFNADDNTFLEAKNAAALQQGKNLQNSIWFMPLNELVEVLHELYPARDQCKSTIYEITGISDLMRGETAPSETATAQNLKNRYGQQRINRMQRYVQDYVRACLRIMAEISANHFAVETFAEITNLDYATDQEVQQAQQMQMALQQQMQQMQQQGAAMANPMGGSPQPGAPAPSPPQPTPQMQQEMQQVQATMAKIKWSDIMELLRNDNRRYYRVDIETNSTIAADTQEDKQDVTDCMTALSNMFESFQPAVQAGALPMTALKAMTMAVIRRFNFGREVEDAINTMPEQLPQQQNPEQQESQIKQQMMQQEMQQDQQENQQKQQLAQIKMQEEQQMSQFRMAQAQRDEQAAQQKHQYNMAKVAAQMTELQMKTHAVQVESAAKVQVATTNADTAETVAAAKVRGAEAAAKAKGKPRASV